MYIESNRIEESNHIEILKQSLDPDKHNEFSNYIDWLLKNDQWFGLDGSFLGFVDDYLDLSRILRRHTIRSKRSENIHVEGRNFIVYDIGCAAALQHVFFGWVHEYVAIDSERFPEPKFFNSNCRFVRGRFKDLIESGELSIEPDKKNLASYGIANMSLLYQFPHIPGQIHDLDLFNNLFNRKHII